MSKKNIMSPSEYVKVLRMLASTLEVEERCDEAGVEVMALRECADYFESLVKFSLHSYKMCENLNKEFPSNSYMVGRKVRKLMKESENMNLNLSHHK